MADLLFTIYAEREGAPRRFIMQAETKEAAADAVEAMEQRYSWPEGHEAILRNNTTGEEFMFVDSWEAL